MGGFQKLNPFSNFKIQILMHYDKYEQVSADRDNVYKT